MYQYLHVSATKLSCLAKLPVNIHVISFWNAYPMIQKLQCELTFAWDTAVFCEAPGDCVATVSALFASFFSFWNN